MFNAAKEAALDLFIAGDIGFTDMAVRVEQVLAQMSPDLGHQDVQITLDMVYEADAEARALFYNNMGVTALLERDLARAWAYTARAIATAPRAGSMRI